jgi:DNA-binding PadR family transcriptional regulator
MITRHQKLATLLLPTRKYAAVLGALADGSELNGLDIADRTGLLPGTTYPILVRLQRAGRITARWDTTTPPGQPRHLYYRIKMEGQR